MATTISAIILTKNEEENIVDCIKNLKFCNEIIIVDDFSTDKTLSIIKKLYNNRIKIFQRELKQDFAAQRNFALSQISTGWGFFIDADERVTEFLKDEIKIAILNENTFNGYYLKRQDVMWGKKLRYGETARIKLLRLAKKNAGMWKGRVHEVWNVQGRVGELENPLLHFPHKTIREFISEINTYTAIRAEELYTQKTQSGLFSIIFYPKAKFIQNYFFRLGFLDGLQGFLLAIFMSLHSFLVRGKLYFLWKRK